MQERRLWLHFDEEEKNWWKNVFADKDISLRTWVNKWGDDNKANTLALKVANIEWYDDDNGSDNDDDDGSDNDDDNGSDNDDDDDTNNDNIDCKDNDNEDDGDANDDEHKDVRKSDKLVRVRLVVRPPNPNDV